MSAASLPFSTQCFIPRCAQEESRALSTLLFYYLQAKSGAIQLPPPPEEVLRGGKKRKREDEEFADAPRSFKKMMALKVRLHAKSFGFASGMELPNC